MYKRKVMALRVLFLTSNYPRRKGDYAGIFIHDLARYLRKAGHDIIVVAPHYPGSEKKEKLNGIPIRRFRYAFPASQQRLAYGGFGKIENPAVALQLFPYVLGMLIQGITSMKEFDADLLVSFWTFPQALVGVLLKWLFNKPLMIRVFSADLLTAKRIGFFMEPLFTRLFATSDGVLPNSNYTKRLMPQIQALMDKTVTIREGIDLDRFKPTTVFKPSDTKKLLTVARLVERKGIKYLLYAMRNVIQRNLNVKLFIVGEGPERQALEKLAQQLSLQKHVTFTGWVSEEKLVSHYASSDIFILPSTEEALGLVLLEAMSMGLPVVASNVGGIPEIVIDHETGILTPPGDPNALADSIVFLLGNPSMCSAYGKKGRQHVIKNFTWDRIAGYFEKAFHETLCLG